MRRGAMLVTVRPESAVSCISLFRTSGAAHPPADEGRPPGRAPVGAPCSAMRGGHRHGRTPAAPRPSATLRFGIVSSNGKRGRFSSTSRCPAAGHRVRPARTVGVLLNGFEVFMRHIRMEPGAAARTRWPPPPARKADLGPLKRHRVCGDFTYRPTTPPPAGNAIACRTMPTLFPPGNPN